MSTGSWSLVPSGSKLEPAQLLCWYKCCHICLQLQHLSYLQDTHPSQLARFFFHSIIVQLVEAKGTVWSADTFFRKTEKVSISSEIHHELLGKKKKDRKKIWWGTPQWLLHRMGRAKLQEQLLHSMALGWRGLTQESVVPMNWTSSLH